MRKRSPSSRSAAGEHKKPAAPKTITAEELDRRFDADEDISEYVDWSKARRPGREVQRVNVDFPVDLLSRIDREATRLGVTRQAFINIRLADTLAETKAERRAAK